jgi:type IX secretion system PorP/SprF family membrane protein
MIVVVSGSFAQQDPMYTQYINNPITINPAIAGIRQVPSLSTVIRTQWHGMEGAPKTSALSYQTSLNQNKVGLAGSLIHDRIGPVIQTGIYFDYAYHLILDQDKKHKLALGLMGGFNHYTFDLSLLRINGADDDVPNNGPEKRFLPNFGVGAFYYNPNFFVGASLPKILRNSLSDVENTLTAENKEERHFFIMTGGLIDISDDIVFRPSAIGRVVNGSPYSVDINGSIILKNQIWVGALYRLGISWGGMVGWQINKNIFISYSYDLSNKALRGSHFGTHELVVSFDFIREKSTEPMPRFF